MKGIYLGACRAYHPNYDLDYCDIVGGYHINVVSDMRTVDLSSYDYFIASPPCNYYSRANYRRDISKYSLDTKDLLPWCISHLAETGKPFIIENVRNFKLFKSVGIFELVSKYSLFVYFVGRHTYITNVMVNLTCSQKLDFHNRLYAKRMSLPTETNNYRQSGENVHNVLEIWLKYINN